MAKTNLKEVADMFNISASKIRHYENVGLLTCKRDPSNNYRYFDDEDTLKLANILMYRKLGMSLTDIKSVLDNEDLLEKHMYKHVSRINSEIRSLIRVREAIHHIIKSHGNVQPAILSDAISRLEERENIMKKIDYDNVSKVYDSVRGIDQEVIQALLENTNLSSDSRILDLGCGTGNYVKAFKTYTSAEVYGVDPSQGMLDKAVAKAPDVTFAIGTASNIPFDEGSFDLIYMTDVIHHVPNIDEMFEELFRIAKKGARICVCTQSHRQIEKRYMSEFFPDTAVADKKRYPSIYKIIESAERASLDYISTQIVLEDRDVILGGAFRALLNEKGYSMLHQISDKAYTDGMTLFDELTTNGSVTRKSAGASMVWLEKS